MVLIFLSFGVLISETQLADSTTKSKVEAESVDTLKATKSLINSDSTTNNKDNKRRMRNKFIDQDGDGINDNRCNGLGPNNGKGMGKRKRMGKK